MALYCFWTPGYPLKSAKSNVFNSNSATRWKFWTLNPLFPYTLFSKRSAHWFTPVLPVTLGHWPWPRIRSILSNGLDSNYRIDHVNFCPPPSRPIDKIKMTRGQGRWPRDLRELGWFSCALLLKKSVWAHDKKVSLRFFGMLCINKFL